MPRFSYLPFIGTSWAISQRFAEAFAETLEANIALGYAFDKEPELAASLPYSLDIQGAAGVGAGSAPAPKRVAVVPIIGPIAKYDTACGPVGATTFAQRIIEASQERSNAGIILMIDSPGGETRAIQTVRAAMLEAQRRMPVVVVGSQVASAALMISAGADRIFLEHPLAEIGSFGTMAVLTDNREHLEKNGFKRSIIYSSFSTDKNQVAQQAIDGDPKRLVAEILDPITAYEIDYLKARRPQASDPRIFAASMFYATEAVTIGLADEIGGIEAAANWLFAQAEGQPTVFSQMQSQSQNPSPMNKITGAMLPLLFAALALKESSIEANAEGIFDLPAGAGHNLMTAFAAKYGKALPVSGVAFAADGSFSATAEQLVSINGFFAQAEIDRLTSANTATTTTLQQTTQQIQQLANLPEPPVVPAATVPGQIVMPTSGWNAVSDDKPWNRLAWMQWQVKNGLASRHELMAVEMQLNSSLVVDQMRTELGAFHRAQNNSIVDVVWPTASNAANFPAMSTGIYDELPQTALFSSSFLQARNKAWAEAGKFEFQADKMKVKDYQMSYRFKEDELMSFMKSWLAEVAGKDHPFHTSFISFLSNKIAVKIREEIEKAIFKGYYLVPADGVAGKPQHAIHGLGAVLLQKYNENRMLPFRVGKGDYIHFDGDGNPNQNHTFYKVQKMIEMMPQEAREGGPWTVAISVEDYRQYMLFFENVLLKNPNYAKAGNAWQREGFTVKGHPNWVDGAIVIYQPGWIVQGYREKGSENKLNFQQDKRDTIVFMDGAHVIEPVFTGYKYATRAELEASRGERQLVFTNLEFGALSPAELAVNATTADATKHYAFVTQANTGATILTDITGKVAGQTYYITGGSDTNPTTIQTSNANFQLAGANVVLKANTEAEFYYNGTKLVLVGLRQVLTSGVATFPVDNQTPSVSGGVEYVVSATNASDKVNITDLLDASEGAIYTINGATGTNTCVLKNNARLVLGADVTMTTGTVVKLRYTNMRTFVKIN